MDENKKRSYWLVHDRGLEIREYALNPDTNRPNSNNLFEHEIDAIARQSFLKSMYTSFQRTPYVNPNLLEENLTKLRTIESEITLQLKNYPNFDGIDFCDVRAGGIQIRGFHKAITGYTYGNQITIKYDFSNWKECIEQFIDDWKRSDIEESVKSYQSFLDAGDRWGWD